MSEIFTKYHEWACNQPDMPALVQDDESISYRTLWEMISRQSEYFLASGVITGERIVLSNDVQNTQWVIGVLAALNAGLQVVMPDIVWDSDEHKNQMKKLAPSLLLNCENGINVSRLSEYSNSDENNAAGIWLFTSGTTNRPKGYFRSMNDLEHMIDALNARLPEGVVDCKTSSLCLAPLFHGYGFMNSLLLIHLNGGKVVLQSAVQEQDTITLMEEHGINVLYAWPSHYNTLNQAVRIAGRKYSGLKWCVSSSFHLEKKIKEIFFSNFGCSVRHQYGMTETGPLCLNDENPLVLADGCVGRPLQGVEILIVDEKSIPVSAGVSGNIVIKLESSSVEGLEQAMNNFQYTNDIGYIDASGRVYVEGRAVPFSDERKEV